MKRRDFLKIISLAGVTSALNPWPHELTASPRRSRPINILFLMDDQHRGDCIGAAGAGWLRTPNLDRLAGEGALFRKAYSSLPSCLPARVSLLTGKSPWAHGVLTYTPMAERYAQEKPRIFTNAGYRTHGVGKMHFGDATHGYETVVLEEAWRGRGENTFRCHYRQWFEKNHPGKDVDATGLGYTDHRGGHPFPYDEALHSTCWTAQQAINFIEGYDGQKPWFLKVSFKRPHPPFDPPKRLMTAYEAMALPEAEVGPWAEKAYGHFKGGMEKTPNAPRGHYPKEDIHRSRAAYYASITHVDEQIGKVLKALERRGELAHTLILFTADHGDMMGDQHLWRKTYAYEGSARVPMILRWPESLGDLASARRGQVLDHLVELRDVLPTFLDAAGLPKPQSMDGQSMLDPIRGKDGSWRKILDLEHGTCYWKENAWVALTDGHYKYIYFTLTGEQQLFHLERDPHELVDLAQEPGNDALLKLWRKRLIEHLAPRGAPWIENGDLAVQKSSVIYGPNHEGGKSVR